MDQEIGYYTDDAFDTGFPEGSYVEMGGRVVDTRAGGNHTTTPALPACGGARFAATIMKYLGISAVGQLFQDSVDRTVVTTPGCYGAQPLGFGADKPGYNVAYGGPGGLYCDIP
ncbi:hypothetical protein DAI22_06g031200 [Oryza sativa Japonica Group]|nr:hypothetical protein DAI22_06g031200 [Oryza sativa Japonica Group]